MDDLENAEEALVEANNLNNHDAKVWAYLSMLCLRRGRRIEAEQAFKYACKTLVFQATNVVVLLALIRFNVEPQLLIKKPKVHNSPEIHHTAFRFALLTDIIDCIEPMFHMKTHILYGYFKVGQYFSVGLRKPDSRNAAWRRFEASHLALSTERHSQTSKEHAFFLYGRKNGQPKSTVGVTDPPILKLTSDRHKRFDVPHARPSSPHLFLNSVPLWYMGLSDLELLNELSSLQVAVGFGNPLVGCQPPRLPGILEV
ncbi:unnamed protein product [Protopolystoma xenopodis]|uniref:Uncharacterized protein n=1 Tax=Protopolystoma xenopodis TaxID=117903 RepID=A0A448WHH6_9PLAT|nr:unnamed protein product [Protopolystoma xenopodis]